MTSHSITLFTIGFTGKSAEEFLREAPQGGGRAGGHSLDNVSQLAGFTKKRDLEYLLACDCRHRLCPRAGPGPHQGHFGCLQEEADRMEPVRVSFQTASAVRRPHEQLTPGELDHACLLCSEPTAEHCHRRLVAEYLREQWKEIAIEHL